METEKLILKATPTSILLEYFYVELSKETDQELIDRFLQYVHKATSFQAELILEAMDMKFESNFVITEASSIFHTPLWRFMFMNLTEPGIHFLN